MGTRGFVGFVAGERETICYNQFDSYPSGVGLEMLRFALGITDSESRFAQARVRAAALVHVSDEVPPTQKDIDALEPYTDTRVGGTGPDLNWYQLLRETQGDPEKILESGRAEHVPEWPADSVFCEWGYLLDLDTLVLEVYRGFQKAPHTDGRYHGLHVEGDNYYPVRLIASWPLNALPTREEFLRALGEQE